MPYDIVDAYEDIKTLEEKYQLLVNHLVEKGIIETQTTETKQEKVKKK